MSSSISHNNKLSYTWLFAVLVVCTIIVQVRMQPISPVDTEQGRFSAVEAKVLLDKVLADETPHPVDSPANRDVQKRISEQLTAMGYEVEVQDDVSCRYYNRYVCARVRNLITHHKGTHNTGTILLSAHYDSVAAAPGASDAGSAVAALLEIAQMLKESEPAKNDVIFLFNEGEEVGLLGAHSFIEQNPLFDDVKLAINIEARGSSGQSILFETSRNNSWLIDLYSESARRPTTNSMFDEIYKFLPNNTDLTLYNSADVFGLNFAYAEKLPNYHTANDSLEKLDMGSLQHHGDNVYDTLLLLMDFDFSTTKPGDLVFTDILGYGVVSWPESYSLFLALSLTILFTFAAWRIRKLTQFSLGSVVSGLTTFVLSLVVAGAGAYLLNMIMIFINGYTTPWNSNHLANWLALWTTVFLTTSVVYALIGRNRSIIGNFVGLWFSWSILAILTSLFVPGASFLFIIPSLVATLLLLCFPAIVKKYEGLALPFTLSLSSIVALLVLLPIVFYIDIMLGFAGLGPVVMGVILGMAFSSVSPIVMAISNIYLTKSSLVSLAIISIATIVWSVVSPVYTSERPLAMNVYYIQNGDDDTARIAVGSKTYPASNEVYSVMGENIELNQIFPWSSNMFYTTSIDSLKLDAINLIPVAQTSAENARDVSFKIESQTTSQNILFYIPKEAQLQSISYAGKTLDYVATGDGEYDQFNCIGESCIGQEISFKFLEDEPVEIIVAKGISRVPESLRDIQKARDNNGVAIHGGDESYIISRIKI
ncbi:peptidase M28-like protein [Alteromonas sp. 76-1]|uniref:M20/M25/M40 family metallo-hydrolase n=1 Tax=Alteromonas sp. 76-1 TaxID=2358187 RepID=UPI000FD178E4|nr:M20/M25/M40 family metallo-hydrolase [Alteromonas sp. 76-1]VEL98338.1 peptidase M28-like protein [Alteromonas sp. 76-1]